MLVSAFKIRRKGSKHLRKPRGKALLWLFIISLLIGAFEAAVPLDVLLRIKRATVLTTQASGKIALVAIDTKSLSEVGAWPWSRSNFAAAIEAVSKGRPEKIAIDHEFIVKAVGNDDDRFINAVRNAPTRISIGHAQPDTERHAASDMGTVNPALAREVDQVSIDVWKEFLGLVWQVPYSIETDGVIRPSMASFLANRPGPTGEFFRLDYRINTDSIPIYSAADVISGKVAASAFTNKRVVIAPTALKSNDFFNWPTDITKPGVYVQIIAAETLMKGTPKDFGWWPMWILGVMFAFGSTRAKSPKKGMLIAAFGAALVVVVPIVSESFLIFLDLAPALLLLLGVFITNLWSSFAKRRSHSNLVSGLPNFGALKERGKSKSALVVAMVQNLPQIQLALNEAAQGKFMTRLVARLSSVNGGEAIYHTDEGTFVWFVDDSPGNPLGHQMDGLFRIFQAPFNIDGQSVDVNLSLGVDSRADLPIARRFDGAKIASLEACESGARWQSFEEASHHDAAWRISVLGELDQALNDGQLWVAYQPKVGTMARELTGAEALVRWSHPTKGDIRPDAFIPQAEEHGRMSKLTAFVLEQAIKDAASIQIDGGPMPVAVNMSARSLEDDEVVGLVSKLLEKYDYPAERLTLELTESAAIRDGKVSKGLFDTLKGLGVRISIDDYGTGFSTLGYMKHIPSDEIKIDRSFVSALETSHSDRLLVGSTIELAHSLGRVVVAEGVESEPTADILISLGCDRLQGYLTGAPCEIGMFKARYVNRKIKIAA